MFKKTISILMLISFVSMLYCSCSEDMRGLNNKNEGYVGLDQIVETLRVDIQDLGAMHTDVLEEFNARHPFASGKKVHIEEYLLICTESINSALSSRNIDQRVVESDIIEVLNVFIKVRDEGVADLFNVSEEIPLALFDYAVEQKILMAEEARQYVKAIEDIDICLSDADKSLPIRGLSCNCVTSDPIRDAVFEDVLLGSAEFWDHVIVIARSDTTSSDGEIDLQKLNTIMLLYWDASWTLIGGMIGGLPGAFVGIMVASTLFILFGEDLMGPLYDNFR